MYIVQDITTSNRLKILTLFEALASFPTPETAWSEKRFQCMGFSNRVGFCEVRVFGVRQGSKPDGSFAKLVGYTVQQSGFVYVSFFFEHTQAPKYVPSYSERLFVLILSRVLYR